MEKPEKTHENTHKHTHTKAQKQNTHQNKIHNEKKQKHNTPKNTHKNKTHTKTHKLSFTLSFTPARPPETRLHVTARMLEDTVCLQAHQSCNLVAGEHSRLVVFDGALASFVFVLETIRTSTMRVIHIIVKTEETQKLRIVFVLFCAT